MSLTEYARQNPVPVGALCLALAVGTGLGTYFFAEVLSPTRSALGGALAGFGCWLIIMFGRIIGD